MVYLLCSLFASYNGETKDLGLSLSLGVFVYSISVIISLILVYLVPFFLFLSLDNVVLLLFSPSMRPLYALLFCAAV